MAALFLVASLLVLLSLAIARFFEGFGVPSLLLFLVIGMLAGKEGANIVALNDPALVQGIGVFSLILILYSGGLGTHWPSVKPYWRQALALSTVGVLATAALVGAFTHYCLGFTWLQGLLLGSIISSTDAAAVFASLRSRNLDLKPGIRHLLELESGSNDPMAVFLTVSLIHLSLHPGAAWWPLMPALLLQAALGLLVGWVLGQAAVFVANHARFTTEGFTMVFFLAAGVFTYGLAETLGGSGFLAVYLSAIICGNRSFVQKKSVTRFYDGLSWLAQIGMFLSLGLLVQPSALLPVLSQGLMVTAFLIFAARPLAVWMCLAPIGMHWREICYVGWVGLRGAVPIVLATYLLVKDSGQGLLTDAPWLFNLVFFIVLGSALLQGWSVSPAARLLQV
jgi:cell volume regulation protein A